MTGMQLPAHLQGRQTTGMAARAAEGMGSSLPPHISISGNKFTFVDASGNEAAPMLTFDGYIVDVSDVMCKRYYEKEYDAKATTYEPPTCWSANGIAPSREATKPQATRCELCPHNERGSAISKMSGTAIKACRDEKWIAVMNPAFGNMVFQLVVTPGSFKNWKGFVAQLENYKVDPQWVQTRFSFEDKQNGVLQFTMITWTPPEHLAVIDAALAERKTDLIVGRLDQPRTGALPGPQGHQTALPPNQLAPAEPPPGFAPGAPGGNAQFVPQQEIIPPGAPQAPFAPAAAPAPTQQFAPQGSPPFPSPSGTPLQPGTPMQSPVGGATTASPSEPASAAQAQPTQRRRRNSAAAAAPAQNAAPAPSQAPPAPFAPAAAPQAPFAPSAAQVGPGNAGAPPAGNNFGISPGAPVANPEMSQMLSEMFPNAQR